MKKTFASLYDEMMEYVDYDKWSLLIDKRVKAQIEEKNILELGCGTGEIAIRMKKLGYEIKGIDYSKEMIDIAKTKYKDIEFIQKDMRELESKEKYDAIIAVFDTLNYLNSYEELILTLKKIRKALKNKGVFLFDVISKKMLYEMFPEGVFADDRKDFTIFWKHSKKGNLEEITTSFFVRESENNYYRMDEVFLKKIFLIKRLDEIIEELGFKLIKKELNEEIAGPRLIYLIQRVD